MLAGAARQTTPRADVELGEGGAEVAQGETTPARQGDEEQVTQAATEPRRQGRRQPPEGGRQAADDQTDCFLRSRTTSTMIGTIESTMTTPTTMWMCAPMLGMACASR